MGARVEGIPPSSGDIGDGALSSKKQSTQSGTSTQTADPYGPAAGGINAGLGMATSYLNNPASQGVYGGDRVADLSGMTRQGMAGLAGNTGYGTAENYYRDVVGGDYLNAGNPYISQVQQSVNDAVMPGINATFGRSGMTGSTIHQNQLAQGLSNGMAGHLFANYENERNRQAQAAGMLPAMLRQQATDQITAGGIDDQHRQNVLNAAMQQFEEQRTAGIRPVAEAMPYLMQGGQAFGTRTGQSTTTNTSQSSPFDQILGGAMMGIGGLSGLGYKPFATPQAASATPQVATAAAMPSFSTGAQYGMASPYMMGGMPQSTAAASYNPAALQFSNVQGYY